MKEKKHTPVLDIIIFAVGVALIGITLVPLLTGLFG